MSRQAGSGHREEADPMTTTLWTTARTAADWLSATNGDNAHQTAMQLMKVTEEAGEAASAYIGMTGQNPRKGTTHTAADVAAELCDVILAAATVLHRFTDDPAGFLDQHAARVHARITAKTHHRAKTA